jgi:type II secretory pathway pseudopilin PulG
LVVITVIAVLLAIMTPALQQAIYQAELAVCGANLHAVGVGLHTYTIDFRRYYPIRNREFKTTSWRDTNIVIKPPLGDFDDRPPLRGYMTINEHLNCPLNRFQH